MKIRRSFLSLLAVTAVTALAACAGVSPHGSKSGVRDVPKGNERIVFRAPVFENGKVTRAQFLDPELERQEYALFQGEGGAQAEVIFAQTVDQFRDIVIEFGQVTSQTLETWNFTRGRVSLAGSSRQASNARLPFYVHEFTNTGTGQSCFGFKAEWDLAATDRQARFTRQMFGYYCAPKGKRLNAVEIEEVIGTVGIRGVTEQASFLEVAGGPIHDPNLEALVQQGSPAGQTGNAEFPFFVLQFFDSGGGGES